MKKMFDVTAWLATETVKKEAKEFDFGMFTKEGNERVADIAAWHKVARSGWEKVEKSLAILEKMEMGAFEECTDTEVRDNVWVFINGEAE
jgi:4-alpha-glucanotransferase